MMTTKYKPHIENLFALFIAALLAVSVLLSCKSSVAHSSATSATNNSTEEPALGTATKIADGILLHEVYLRGRSRKVWIYLPEKPAATKIPCVLIAPAGSRLFHGMELGTGDRAEHLPYVRAGFAVIAYELDGPFGENGGSARMKEAMKAYMQAKAGLDNQQAALAFALAKLPMIDADRIYVAGHSSAATHALLVAESDPRIKGCIAFAAAYDISKRLGVGAAILEGEVPGARDFFVKSSPATHIAQLKCPVFLFHAKDDKVVKFSETVAFFEALKRTNPNVTFLEASNGGHYEPMIQQGIPAAIKWLQALAAPKSEKQQ
jgi:dipeptidyl aminopeptidase/acylaminoacyl peptidase